MCLGVPGRVLEVHDDRGTAMGTVDFGGTTREVCLVYVPEAAVGEHVIVHAGFAIQVLDEAAAAETLALLAELDLGGGGAVTGVPGATGGGGVAGVPGPERFTTDFADPALARGLLEAIEASVTRPWSIMEVCGGQTHAILRHGIDQLLPEGLRLVHGPGCPVCVTPVEVLDRAIALARRPEVTLCTFGDMVRVPGSDTDLGRVRAAGGDVRIVYSPLDAVRVAEAEPDREVVLLAVGFETTAPMTAMAARQAHDRGVANLSLLVSHVLVPPAIAAIAGAATTRVDAFLAAGHVCTVMGWRSYEALAERYGVPIVVTGFEPLDVLEGVRRAVVQLEAGRAEVENAYARAVRAEGNVAARAVIGEVFETCDRSWRGIGTIPASGWRLRPPYDRFDAVARFDLAEVVADEPAACRAGEVLQGLIEPSACEAFGTTCTPATPLGAPMVSAEGACAAYFRYRRLPGVPVRAG